MSSIKRVRNWDPNQMFDISHDERRAIEERTKMRNALRLEFQKKVSNPYNGPNGYIIDPAVQRFLAMRSNHFEQFKATPKSFAFAFFTVLAPIGLLWWNVAKNKRELEHECRTGQISYRDRMWRNL